MNSTFVTLVPKDRKIGPKDLISISLIQTVYKIIAKVLAKSLRNVLGDVIHPSQGACQR